MATQPVRLLSSETINQIAAGEVIERPASVIRELIDNAIDAGASEISVRTEDAGIANIVVSDNGRGMDRADAELAVERHATSKISSFEDLLQLGTFGFRGEALPSIASVSNFSLRTRTEASDAGTEVRIEGHVKSVRACATDQGTVVEVANLFGQVPARRKFLKAKATENAWISETVTEFALSHPEIAFRLERDGRCVLDYPKAKDAYQRVQQEFDKERLVVWQDMRHGVGLTAHLCAPERARAGAHLFLYVNGRRVRDRALSRAIQFGYGSVLPAGKLPFGAVFISVAPDRVDVNVHPQKSEVRFVDARSILDTVARMVADGLGTRAFAKGFSTGWQAPQAAPVDYATVIAERGSGDVLTLREPSPRDVETHAGPDPWGLFGGTDSRTGMQHPFREMRFLAQTQKMFLLCETDAGLWVLDQHAADERVRFARLKDQYSSQRVTQQQLLFAESVSLSDPEVAFVQAHEADFERLGFSLRVLRDDAVSVVAVPSIVRHVKAETQLRDVLSELMFEGERAFSDRVDMALATVACHAAVRAGDVMLAAEATALLTQLADVPLFEGYCPHGRPVVTFLSREELARRVGR